MCINRFLGFERLSCGCEFRELCLFVFLLFVLVTCSYCICVVIDYFRACLHGGGGPREGEVTRLSI